MDVVFNDLSDAKEPYRHSSLADVSVMTLAASTMVMLEMPAVEMIIVDDKY